MSYGGLGACRTRRRGRLACAVFSIEARDFTCCLAIDNPLLQIGPLVVRNFAVPHAELGFYLAVLPIELEDDKRAAFHLCLAVELVDLVSMQQQFGDAFCGRDFVTGAFVGLNVGVVKESFVVFDSRERIADICLARSDRFDLAAFQFDACFVALENAIVAKRLRLVIDSLAIVRARPARVTRALAPRMCQGLSAVRGTLERLVIQLASNDFLERNVSERHSRRRFH